MCPVQKRTLEKDDAVANVVVMLLILSVIVIAFAVIVGVYLPSLKETAELQHSADVKEAFLKFSADVDATYARAQPGVYSQVFSLGGGDIQFSTAKSAGTVEAGTELLNGTSPVFTVPYTAFTPIYKNQTRGDTTVETGIAPIRLSTISLNYTPVLSFWADQGYNYSRGVVWVSKNDVYAPVSNTLYNVSDGMQAQEETTVRWIDSFRPVQMETNFTAKHDNSSNPEEITGYDMYYIYSLTLVNFTTGNPYVSGNGDVKLSMSVDRESETEYVL
ncbi:MAG TPA: hypothetical protein O0X27_06345, partial [Methanocorpusculum sp.]|nr:hypothetical protein [Methanocorpusculum sp.]